MLRADIFKCNSESVPSDAPPPARLNPKQYHQLETKCSKAQDLGGHTTLWFLNVPLNLKTVGLHLCNHVNKFLIINLVFLYRQFLAVFHPPQRILLIQFLLRKSRVLFIGS